MILGSVGTGALIGLIAAMMTWTSGHPLLAVFLTYSVIGSLGTLFVAGLAAARMGELGQSQG
jgi:hypothetical protein